MAAKSVAVAAALGTVAGVSTAHLIARFDPREAMSSTILELLGDDDVVVCARADRSMSDRRIVQIGGNVEMFPLRSPLTATLERCDVDRVHVHGGPGALLLGAAARSRTASRFTALRWDLTVYSWADGVLRDLVATRTVPTRQARRIARSALYTAIPTRAATRAAARFDSVFTPDSEVAARLGNVTLVPFGPDLAAQTAQWSDEPTIVFAGRAEPSRGLDDLVTAFELAAATHPTVRLRLALLNYGEHHDAASRWTDELHPRVEVSTEAVDLAALYSTAQVAVFPFAVNHATLTPNLAALEAAAAGLPLVVSSAACLAPCVEDGHSGLVVQRGDVVALAGALVEVVSSRERWEAMSAAATALVAARGGWAAHRAAVNAAS